MGYVHATLAMVVWLAVSAHTVAGDCSTPTSYAGSLTSGSAADRRTELRALLEAQPFTALDEAALKAGVQVRV